MKLDLQTLPDIYPFEEELNLSSYIKESHQILNLDHVFVKGTIEKRLDYCIVKINVKTDASLACALTLKEVITPLDFSETIIFGEHDDADYALEKTLDLDPIIFAYILSEKPYSVFHKDASHEEFEEKKVNSAFENLKDLL
ncbi:conserved hypothetical protein (DUF177) [Alteracholeplasma palmae J233]|uniref:DUF177 domain-containing protein n=1 Tax=Alteracholeplasma palmae (strain ATCC 49389 / J233) TaxID=1318466 RepID=U4KPN1_ALTPJ|nr:DUF177 domain-containing protein [Alteracholeplasma palmae]CCV64230.1 conserved hypothetical protein (DUF177) [Alteracholeplasma palmae J233]